MPCRGRSERRLGASLRRCQHHAAGTDAETVAVVDRPGLFAIASTTAASTGLS